MRITDELLMKWARDASVVARGRGYARTGMVSDVRESADRDGGLVIRSRVSGTFGQRYSVMLMLSRAGELSGSSCSCAAYAVGRGICKHCVATLVAAAPLLADIGTKPEKTPRSEPSVRAARTLISDYGRSAPGEGGETGDVHIEPRLIVSESKKCVSIALGTGRKRMYVVRNISNFIDACVNRDHVSYGVGLEFTHSPEAFDEKSRALAEMLALRRTECEGYARVKSVYYEGDKRFMTLSPSALESFFAIYEGETVNIGDDAAVIARGDVKIPLNADRRPNGDVMLSMNPDVFYLESEGRIYIRDADTVHECSMEMSRAVLKLVRVLDGARGRLRVAAEDLPDFCAEVLSVIEPYVEITGMDALMDCAPEEMTPRLYVDMPTDDRLEMRPAAVYGGDEVNPFREEADGHRRNRRSERAFLRALTGCLGAPAAGSYAVSGDDAMNDFIHGGLERLQGICEVRVSDRVRRLNYTPAKRPSVGVSLESNLLKLDVDIGSFPKEELAAVMRAYREKRRYYRLKSGEFVDLDDSVMGDLARLSEGMQLAPTQLAGGACVMPAFRAMYLDGLMKGDKGRLGVKRESSFRRFAAAINTAQDADYAVPEAFNGVMRMYQEAGYRWLRTLSECGLCGILADDMGLGKTIQFIALLLSDVSGLASLIACPASLTRNWESEIHTFAPTMDVVVIAGTAEERRNQIRTIGAGQVAVTSYDSLKRDTENYKGIDFMYFALDEAQYIKNRETKAAQSVKLINCRRRFALTGTPIENRLSELWSIFDFLMPGYLGPYARFKARYETPIMKNDDAGARDDLKRLVTPFILRRLKSEVLAELPPKSTSVRRVALDGEQRKLYDAYALSAAGIIREMDEGQAGGRMQVLKMLTRLRQLCCDPALCLENYAGGSAKLEACVELVQEARDGGHRALLFSQFTSMLKIIADRFDSEGISYMTLTGDTPQSARLAMTRAFNEGTSDVFLISLKAGGTGLNLTGADTVIHYDPWWNLAAQDQATDRAYRIGQKNSVQVYKLIAEDTVEERILELQKRKGELSEILETGGEAAITSMPAEDIISLFSARG